MRYDSQGRLLVSGTAGGAGGGGTPTDISAGIDSSSDINTLVTRATEIRDALNGNRFLVVPAMDSAGTFWLVRYDRSAGTVDYLNQAGVAGTPVFPLATDTADTANVEIKQDYFEALTTVASNWIAGHILTRVQAINTTTLVPAATTWLSQAGAVLATTPVIGTDVSPYQAVELQQLRTLETIATNGNTLLTTIEDQTDTLEVSLGVGGDLPTALPTSAGSLIGVTKGFWSSVSTELASIEASVDDLEALIGATNAAPAANPTTATGLNGVLRGFWSAVATALGTITGDLSSVADNTSQIQTAVSDVEPLIGEASESAAASPAAVSGLNGLLKGAWTTLLAIQANTNVAADPRPTVQELQNNAATASGLAITAAAPVGGGTIALESLYYGNGATAHFLQMHIGTAAPVAGAAALAEWRVRANGDIVLDPTYCRSLPARTLLVNQSLYFVRSSTAGTYTAIAALTAANATDSTIIVKRSF